MRIHIEYYWIRQTLGVTVLAHLDKEVTSILEDLAVPTLRFKVSLLRAMDGSSALL
jgi:hypothetical protein